MVTPHQYLTVDFFLNIMLKNKNKKIYITFIIKLNMFYKKKIKKKKKK